MNTPKEITPPSNDSPQADQAEEKKRGFWSRAFHLYYDGFKNMTWGKAPWMVIIIKLFIMFFVLKLFFFQDFLKDKGDKPAQQEYVSEQLIQRGLQDTQ